MKRFILTVFTLLCVSVVFSDAKPKKEKVNIKVGSYNLMTSDSMVKHIEKNADMSHQRYWCNSA